MSMWPAWRAVSSSPTSSMTLGCRACAPVEGQDVRRRLVRADAEIGVVVVRVERQRLGLAAERLAEPAELDRGEVLDEAQERGPRRGHRSSQRGVVEAVDLPEHDVAVPVQARVQALLLGPGQGHPCAHVGNRAAAADVAGGRAGAGVGVEELLSTASPPAAVLR